jgi:hypothetical protein
MKIIIDIDDSSYINCKNLLKEGTHTYEQLVIAKGKPYEERPQGEWKFDGWGTYCSECGYRPKLGGGKFCSECGADMRGCRE